MTSWITMQCPEGLIYDKNLRSCAIPGDDWECVTEADGNGSDSEDEDNVYGVTNLELLRDDDEHEGDEFLEVIDGNLSSAESRMDTTLVDDLAFSGDGEVTPSVTPSASTVRMITTQLQRLTQLVQHVRDRNDGIVDDNDVTADDLNSFLATQKIQASSDDYQKIDFNSDDKTPMPSNGRIHPEILSDILDQQTQLNKRTTLAMDETTPKAPQRRPQIYVDKDPITEIQLKSGQNYDGTASHQIVVNRPEGSVLFNVPPSHSGQDQQSHAPYFSQDILKTILEISKKLVTQNHQKTSPQASYAPQPFYYAVPIPILSPQTTNNANGYYTGDYRNNVTEVTNSQPSTSPVAVVGGGKKKKKTKPSTSEQSDGALSGYVNSYSGFYQPPKSHFYPTQSHPSLQNPSYYYQNYPSYGNSAYDYQQFPNTYQYPTKNQYSDSSGYNQQQYGDFDGAYYGSRPFVIESSAPSSYVEQSPRPHRKESYATYEADDESQHDENLYDEVEFDDEEVDKGQDELICSFVVQRQANKTDCYRYYVCNAKTKEVLHYTCPVFTAFNDQTKYCDSLSYPACKRIKDRESSSKKNQKIYDEAHKALEQVKKESQKVERIASQMKKESQKIYNRRNQYEEQQPYYQPTFAKINRVQKPLVRQQLVIPNTTPAPRPRQTKKPARRKKKKVKCRDIGNIVDPESSSSYWHCFKGADGRMKRINRSCTQNFIFCPTTRYCSPAGRC